MTQSTWFDDIPVLCNMPPEEAAAALRAVGETETAEVIEAMPRKREPGKFFSGLGAWWPFGDKPAPAYLHSSHAFGHIAPSPPGDEMLPIHDVGNIAADKTLKKIRITLNCLRVAEYPGRGEHQVLFAFYTQHQIADRSDDLHFSATYRVRQGQRAGVIGYPIFVGLNVGAVGLRLKCRTVNVANTQDQKFLGFLESDVFKSGLKLVSTIQPAITPLSEMVLGVTRSVLKRNENKSVQDFDMGLDFSAIPAGARLAEGAYLAVQIPEAIEVLWSWDDWVYNPANGQVVNKDDPQQLIPYNYVILGISRYEEA
jgi:hypothetical protein